MISSKDADPQQHQRDFFMWIGLCIVSVVPFPPFALRGDHRV
jgi:hypothetical protein